jgi:capsular polysaccharide biosynthesis protein
LIVVLVTLAAVGGAAAWIAFGPRHYRAVAQVLVTPVSFDDKQYTGLPVVRDISADPTRAMETAAAIFSSPQAAATTALRLGPGWTQGAVRKAVRVVPVGGANALAFQATAGSGSVAARIANTYVTTALQERRQMLSADAKSLIDRLKSGPRRPPATQLNPLIAVSAGFDPSFSSLHAAAPPDPWTLRPIWRTLALVLFSGLVLGIGAALLLDFVLRRGSSRADVVKLGVSQPSGREDVSAR